MSNKSDTRMCQEIASGVYCMEVGKNISQSNDYFIQSGTSRVLIDATSSNRSKLIKKIVESLFGANTKPISILLMHDHPDYAGSALELAHMWDCPVYVDPDELPYAAIEDPSTVEKYANPQDQCIILPLLRLIPRQPVELMLSMASIKDVVQGFAPDATVPDLPEWQCVPRLGHTPGYVAFFRTSDRVLITGDAIVTANLNSLWGFFMGFTAKQAEGLQSAVVLNMELAGSKRVRCYSCRA